MTTRKAKTTMIDLSEFRAAARRPGPQGCSVIKVAKAMLDAGDTERAERFRAALTDDTIGHEAIHVVVKSWGYQISKDTLGRHRRGACSCANATTD